MTSVAFAGVDSVEAMAGGDGEDLQRSEHTARGAPGDAPADAGKGAMRSRDLHEREGLWYLELAHRCVTSPREPCEGAGRPSFQLTSAWIGATC